MKGVNLSNNKSSIILNKDIIFKIICIIELILASYFIIFDFFIPTFVILVMMVASFIIKKQGFSDIGFKKNTYGIKMIAIVFIAVVVWNLFYLCLIMPALNHLTNTKQDLSGFENVKGNIGGLFIYLAATWTLAAFGEEIVYRGYIQKRFVEFFSFTKYALIFSIILSSVLFGIAHREQGLIGVILTFLDAIFFSFLKHKFNGNIMAAILAHGISNTIGLITFYFVGPIYGFW